MVQIKRSLGKEAQFGGNSRGLRMPQDVFERLGGKQTEQEILDETVLCATCGVFPLPRPVFNGYLPGKCPCWYEAQERADAARLAEEIRQNKMERLALQCSKCYTWLGSFEYGTERLLTCSFANFQTQGLGKEQLEAFMAMLQFSRNPEGNIILWSSVFGSGKTHLAAAVCNALLDRQIPCLFATAQGIFDTFSMRLESGEGYQDLLTMAADRPVLVIDDLDKLHLTQSGFKQRVFFEILDKRYRRGLPTIFTTNEEIQVTDYDIKGMSEYITAAATSRLCDEQCGGLQVFEMTGKDYRRKK